MKLFWLATLVIEFDVMHITDEVTVDGCCLLVQLIVKNPQNLANLMALIFVDAILMILKFFIFENSLYAM